MSFFKSLAKNRRVNAHEWRIGGKLVIEEGAQVEDNAGALGGASGGGGGAIDLVINTNDNTYTCSVTLSECFAKLDAEGWSACNLRLDTSSQYMPSYIVPYKVAAYSTFWIKAYYFSFEKSPNGTGVYIRPYVVQLASNGTVTVEQEGTFTGEKFSAPT